MSRTMSQRQIEERLATMKNIDPHYGPTTSNTSPGACSQVPQPGSSRQITWTGTKNTATAVSVSNPIYSMKYCNQKVTKWFKPNNTTQPRKEIPGKKCQRSPSPVQHSAQKSQRLSPTSLGGTTVQIEKCLSPTLAEFDINMAKTSTPKRGRQPPGSKNEYSLEQLSRKSQRKSLIT